MTRITAFEVPPDEDERFIAAWERARASWEARGELAAAVLHRAWRPDAEFRFVDVTGSDSPEAPGELPFSSHAGVYEVVHEDGAPDGTQGVVLINPFEVPADADERFLAGWSGARDVLAKQRGYLGTRLYRSVDTQARFRFVNIARWSSPLMFSKALQEPAFGQAAAAMPFPSHPALYQVIRG
jgi:heme-degrading monooxygenase HmoA